MDNKNFTSIVNVGIVGAGSWGTALAGAILRKSRHVIHYTKRPFKHDAEINPSLKDIDNISELYTLTNNPQDLIACDVIIFASTAQYMREFISQTKIPPNIPIIIASKGIEKESGLLLSQVIEDEDRSHTCAQQITSTPNIIDKRPIAVLSGPNFAKEIREDYPSLTTLACSLPWLSEAIGDLFQHSSLLLEFSDAPLAIQIAGAMKNAFAVGMGMLTGLQYGDNTKAMFMTKALQEIDSVIKTIDPNDNNKKAAVHPLLTSAGIGDLVLTCYSLNSRNTRFGYDFVQNHDNAKKMLEDNTVEGYHTISALHVLMRRYAIVLPISQALYSILYLGSKIESLAQSLIS